MHNIIHSLNPSHHSAHHNIFNANWVQAEQHRQASRVGYPAIKNTHERCSCCFEQLHKEDIPLNQNTKQLQFLGFGFPLYYSFVRNCIFLLIVCLCSYNILSLHKALVSNKQFCSNLSGGAPLRQATSHSPHSGHSDHGIHELRLFSHLHGDTESLGNHHEECTSWMVDFARIQKKVDIDERILRGVCFFIHLVLLIYIRDKLTKLMEYFDQRTASPSDFSVMLQNIPRINNLLNEIPRVIALQFQNQKIVDIILLPDLKNFEELQHQKNHLVQQLRQKVKAGEIDSEHGRLTQQIQIKERQIHRYVVQQKNNYRSNQIFAEKAIVMLNSEPDKQDLLQKFEENGFRNNSWHETTISQAPEPKQFIWENIYLSNSQKASYLAVGWGLSILVLVILTVLFAIISKFKSDKVQKLMKDYKQNHNQGSHTSALILVILLISFIVLFNKLGISTLFHKFTDMERHSSTYKFQFSFCLKYCLGLFFTTALMTLIVQAFWLRNYYKHDFGVIEQQTMMYIVNSIFVPLFWALHPFYLLKKFKAWRSFGTNYYTQQEANKMMEYPEYDVGKRYGEVLQVIWFTFLYMTLIPIGGILSSIGLALYYWVDKFNLLHRSTIHSHVSGELIYLTLSMLDFSLVLRVVGEIIFDYQIRDGPIAFTWVCLGIALIYQLIPIQDIIGFFNDQKFNSQKMTYNEARPKFTSDYYHEHVLFSHLKEDRDRMAQELTNKLVKYLL